jgi:hypothetical protein
VAWIGAYRALWYQSLHGSHNSRRKKLDRVSALALFRLPLAVLASATLIAQLFWSTTAHADDCDAIAAALAASEAGAVVTGRENNYITINDRFAAEVSIACPTPEGFPIDLTVNWKGAFPPATFYAFAGRAGHIVVGAPEKEVSEGARRCAQAALRSKDETASLTFGLAYFECTAFSRDGGATDISIYRASDAPHH